VAGDELEQWLVDEGSREVNADGLLHTTPLGLDFGAGLT
jgi:hypothetical protein